MNCFMMSMLNLRIWVYDKKHAAAWREQAYFRARHIMIVDMVTGAKCRDYCTIAINNVYSVKESL